MVTTLLFATLAIVVALSIAVVALGVTLLRIERKLDAVVEPVTARIANVTAAPSGIDRRELARAMDDVRRRGLVG